jgi:hypothetical protein
MGATRPADKTGKVAFASNGEYDVDIDGAGQRHFVKTDVNGSYKVGDRVVIRAVPAPETTDDWDWVIDRKA